MPSTSGPSSSLLVAGTGGSIKNPKRIHLADLERSIIVRSMKLGNYCSDVLSLCSIDPEHVIAGLRNGQLFSVDLRERRHSSSTPMPLLKFQAGIGYILKPSVSDCIFVVGTLHDQVC